MKLSGILQDKTSKTQWSTAAGKFVTDQKVNINFKMPELSETAIVNHQLIKLRDY